MVIGSLQNLYTLLNHTLRQESRSVSAHRFRIGSLFIAVWILLIAHYSTWFMGSSGGAFIRSLVYLDMALILVAGSSYFGSVITEEKEQGTLGLLKLAGFSNAGLMFGKSSSRIMTSLVIFVIQLPFAFLAIVLGGTTTSQILAAYLALAAYLILLGNVGLFLSVICRRNVNATTATFLVGLLALFSGKIASIGTTTPLARKLPWVSSTLEWVIRNEKWVSAHSRLQAISIDRRTPLVDAQFWGSLGMAALLFMASWLLFDYFTEYTESQDPHRSKPGRRPWRWQLWVSRSDRDPFAWKEFHFGTGGITTMVAKTSFYAALIGGTLFFEAWLQKHYLTTPVEVLMGSLVVVFLLEILAFSGNFLGGELAEGTLPNLVLTPHSLSRITLSKFAGHLLSWTPTLAAIGVVTAIIWTRDSVLLSWEIPQMTLAACFVLLLHLTAYFSLRVRRGAVAWAVVTLILGAVVVLPVLNMIRISLRDHSTLVPGYIQPDGPEFWAPLLYFSVMSCLGLQIAIGIQTRHSVGE